MNDHLSNLSAAQLQQAAAIKEKIEVLERDLVSLLNGGAPKPIRTMSAAARARIAAAQRARWAKQRGTAGPQAAPVVRKFSPAARRRLAAATRARWARAKAAGHSSLKGM